MKKSEFDNAFLKDIRDCNKGKENNLLVKIRAAIKKHSMLSGGETVLVGLSGGADSVCLLTALNKLSVEFGIKLHAIYIDHALRPVEVPAEIEFCKKLCEGLSLPFITKTVDVKTFAAELGINKQEAARELRYKAFNEALFGLGGGKIALGHTADDQVETFLMRMLRGAGPKGLSGIPPVRKDIMRPLIEIERAEIEGFIEELRVNHITDSSNLKDDYLRNRLRHIFIPELKKINPSISMTTARTMAILREEESYFELIVTKTLMRLISRKADSRIELFLSPIETMERVILRRVLRRAIGETRGLRGLEFSHIEEIIGLIKQGQPGDRLNLPKGLRVIKDYALLIITSEQPQRLVTHTLNIPGEAVLREIQSVIKASIGEEMSGTGDKRTIIILDADKTGKRLVIRARQEGDFFYPMGFGKRKKLQDFFVDEKIARELRDTIPVILSGKEIVWLAGLRGDERFKVTKGTKRFLKLELSPLRTC